MKKFISLFFVLLLVSFSFASCGEKKDIVLNINSLAEKLDEIYVGSDVELVDIEGEAIDIHYGIKNLYSSAIVKGSITITSDEYIVLECTDDESAQKAYDLIDDYRSERIKLFSSYASEQVPKLENALLKKTGRYVVFVVAENVTAANEIWKGFVN